MKSSFPCVIASLAIVLASSAGAQTAPTQASPAPQQGTTKAKKICKSEPTVGTRFATKVCKTAEEWAELQRRDRDMVDGYKRSACMSGAASASGGGQAVSC